MKTFLTKTNTQKTWRSRKQIAIVQFKLVTDSTREGSGGEAKPGFLLFHCLYIVRESLWFGKCLEISDYVSE
jgi:hypothetical protein